MVAINVIDGDITQVESDALITAVNSGGMWFGGIDSAIMRVAGNAFHGELAGRELQDGDAHWIPGDDSTPFKSVLFVIDDLRRPLEVLLRSAFEMAEDNDLRRVTLPTIRTGVMAGAFEETIQAALDAMADAIKDFAATSPKMESITIVTFRDIAGARCLRELLANVA